MPNLHGRLRNQKLNSRQPNRALNNLSRHGKRSGKKEISTRHTRTVSTQRRSLLPKTSRKCETSTRIMKKELRKYRKSISMPSKKRRSLSSKRTSYRPGLIRFRKPLPNTNRWSKNKLMRACRSKEWAVAPKTTSPLKAKTLHGQRMHDPILIFRRLLMTLWKECPWTRKSMPMSVLSPEESEAWPFTPKSKLQLQLVTTARGRSGTLKPRRIS